MTIGEKIKTRRIQLRLTIQDISDKMGVAKSTIHYWENGNTKRLKLEDIKVLAKILKVDAQSLMYDDEPLALINEEKNSNELDQEIMKLIKKMNFIDKINLFNDLHSKYGDKK